MWLIPSGFHDKGIGIDILKVKKINLFLGTGNYQKSYFLKIFFTPIRQANFKIDHTKC